MVKKRNSYVYIIHSFDSSPIEISERPIQSIIICFVEVVQICFSSIYKFARHKDIENCFERWMIKVNWNIGIHAFLYTTVCANILI